MDYILSGFKQYQYPTDIVTLSNLHVSLYDMCLLNIPYYDVLGVIV